MLIGKLLARFKSEPKPVDKPVDSANVAWSETTIYRAQDFPKYNPDDLMTRKGFGIYRKMMTDEQVKAVVRFKRDAITSRRWYFECEHEALSEEQRDKRKKLFCSIIENMAGSWTDSLNGIMSAMYHGFSITEKIQKYIEHDGMTWVGIDKLKIRPFDTFFYHVDSHGVVIRFVQEFEGKQQDLDVEKFIHFVQNPDYDEHYGASELREAYRSWYSKDIIIRFQNIHLERHASGFLWAQPEQGKSLISGSREYADLQNALSNVSTKTAIIMPSGIALHMEKPNTTDTYEKAIAQHDKAIAKALLVPNLMGISEQGSTGSYSQSQTQLEAFLWTLDADANRLEETINEQLFRQLGDINFGDGYYPKFRFNPISETRKVEIVRLWKELVQGGAVTRSETDESHIREMLEFPEIAEDAETQQEDKAPDYVEPKEEELPDETIVGASRMQSSCGHNHGGPVVASKAAFTTAMKRVDFAVIGSKSTDSAETAAHAVAAANGDAVARMMRDASTIGYDVEKVTALKFSPAELSAMKKEVMAGLAEGWKIGGQHASKELRKADKAKFAVNYFEVKDRALTDVAGAFFKARGHTITGSISGQTQAIIQNTLLDAIKNSRSFDETYPAIYKALESEGLLTEEDVIEALGTKTVKNTEARIHTIMRTSTFEAINEARYQMFADPDLNGFVEALEYSAVLDDRTTEICSSLNGKIYPLDSEEWQTFSPPNHFACRSLLIAVTQKDDWVESAHISIKPQKGFGF